MPPLALCVLLSLLLPLDVFQAMLTHGDGNNARRLVTGLLWGFCATAASLELLRLLSSKLARGREKDSEKDSPPLHLNSDAKDLRRAPKVLHSRLSGRA